MENLDFLKTRYELATRIQLPLVTEMKRLRGELDTSSRHYQQIEQMLANPVLTCRAGPELEVLVETAEQLEFPHILLQCGEFIKHNDMLDYWSMIFFPKKSSVYRFLRRSSSSSANGAGRQSKSFNEFPFFTRVSGFYRLSGEEDPKKLSLTMGESDATILNPTNILRSISTFFSEYLQMCFVSGSSSAAVKNFAVLMEYVCATLDSEAEQYGSNISQDDAFELIYEILSAKFRVGDFTLLKVYGQLVSSYPRWESEFSSYLDDICERSREPIAFGKLQAQVVKRFYQITDQWFNMLGHAEVEERRVFLANWEEILLWIERSNADADGTLRNKAHQIYESEAAAY